MTCKDCLCSDVCIETRDQIQMLAYQSRNDIEKVCSNFKDKSRFVELPCKVGDTVYYITGIGHNLIKPAKIKEIILDDSGISDLYVQGDGFNFENTFDIFYLTREEAEEKLKEMKYSENVEYRQISSHSGK